jgi:hypothetical protein
MASPPSPTPSPNSRPAPAGRWRFGIRSLLLLVLLVACVAGVWRWRAEQRLEQMVGDLNQQENLLANDQGGGKEFENRFYIGQLVRHRSFRSSGLYRRLLATADGFGEFQLKFTNIAEFQLHNRQQVCLTFLDLSGPPREVIIVAQPNSSRLAWIEIKPTGKTRWTSKLQATSGEGMRAIVTLAKQGELYQQVYRLSPEAIELIETRPVPDKAASEAELIRAMGIDSGPRGQSLPGLEGPESDLRR